MNRSRERTGALAFSSWLFALLVVVSGCGGQRCGGSTDSSSSTATPDLPPPPPPPLPASWPTLPAKAGAVERTDDGIPIMHIADVPRKEGSVTWIVGTHGALDGPQYEATDGRRVYFARRKRVGVTTDILIRDGRAHDDVLHSLAKVDDHPGGCAAAADGDVVLVYPRPSIPLGGNVTRGDGLDIWLLGADGTLQLSKAPRSSMSDEECRAWLDPDGAITLAAGRIWTWDGTSVSELTRWSADKLTLGAARGPRYCLRPGCDAEALQAAPMSAQLKQALACDATWAATGEWVAGICRDGKQAVRFKTGGAIETLEQVLDAKLPDGGPAVALTDRGDLVVGLGGRYDFPRFTRYYVWSFEKQAYSPERTLLPGEIVAHASPTLLIKGAPSVPEVTESAWLHGVDIGFGVNGSTLNYTAVEGTEGMHAARAARARKAFGGGRLVVANNAVVDLDCGGYARVPMGADSRILPSRGGRGGGGVRRKAQSDVVQPPQCLKLARVAVLPGDPELVLALSASKELYAAWLPASDPAEERPLGWKKLGKALTIDGENGAPLPGADTKISRRSWQYGGAAVVRVEGAEILLTTLGANTLPAGTKAMALAQWQKGVWGAVGPELVVCEESCRVLDPGVSKQINAVVPRTRKRILLGYEDGRVGLYDVPPEGGEPVATHPLVGAFKAFLVTKGQ